VAPKKFREVRRVLPMEPDRELEAGEMASAVAQSVNMDPDRIDEVRMAVHEAFINASEHSRAPDRRVYVTVALEGEVAPEALRITVRDTGTGFPATARRDTMPAPRELPRKRGWGLTIIRRLMDEVEISSNEDGTVIVMYKRIADGKRGVAGEDQR
jgi:anti-sigma regulatory factor (Ser/Thr protein kinase)